MIVVFITVKLKKLILIIAVLVVLIAAIIVLLVGCGKSDTAETAVLGNTTATLVIDPGHGGIDGGAVSESGVKESDINLAISDKMACLADFLGVRYVKTVEADAVSGESAGYSEHENLVSRAKLVNSTENAVLISVHQNEYPNELVKGAEVMYADTDGSRNLAESMQSLLVSQLDPENRRVFRPAPQELLLTRSINCPGVLVECGFLSNPSEAEKLASWDYQMKIAAILVASYINFSATYYNA